MRTQRQKTFARHHFAALALWIIVLGTRTSAAQAAGSATGQVQLPDGEMKEGLRVRAIPKSPGGKSRTHDLRKGDFNYTSHAYTFTIDRLRPGKYSFVVCDGLDYRSEIKTESVSAGSVPTEVDFLLEDQTRGTDSIVLVMKGPDGRPLPKDVPVFLKQAATGCSVSKVLTNENGVAEFHGLPKGNYEPSTDEADQDSP